MGFAQHARSSGLLDRLAERRGEFQPVNDYPNSRVQPDFFAWLYLGEYIKRAAVSSSPSVVCPGSHPTRSACLRTGYAMRGGFTRAEHMHSGQAVRVQKRQGGASLRRQLVRCDMVRSTMSTRRAASRASTECRRPPSSLPAPVTSAPVVAGTLTADAASAGSTASTTFSASHRRVVV